MTPSRIVLLRHGEKPADKSNPNLSPAGQARAQMLAKLIPQRFPNPVALFATADSAHSDRPEETLQPTADALNLPLQAPYADAQYAELATLLTTAAAYDGQLVIVCWHHGKLPDLAKSLGVAKSTVDATVPMIPDGSKMKWNPAVFDYFWILDFSAGGVSLTASLQQ